MSPSSHSSIHPKPVQASALSLPTKHPAKPPPDIAPPRHRLNRPATHRTTLRVGPLPINPAQPLRFAPRSRPKSAPPRLKSFLEKTLTRATPPHSAPQTLRPLTAALNCLRARPAVVPVPPQKSAKSRAQRPRLPLRGSRGRWARVPHKARHEPRSPSHWPPPIPPPIMAALTRQGRDPCQSEPSTSVPGTEPAPTSAS